MKKNTKKRNNKKFSLDIEQLKHSKNVSTRGKLEWLASALYFGKMRRF